MPVSEKLRKDVNAIQQIAIIPTLLDVICKTTGMRFAAVARVTETNWVTCSVQDEISFGLKPGDELVLETTICNEIRQSRKAVIINSVEGDEHFRQHHTPLQYGFQSYISVPIILKNGQFFGTLCAIDPKPNNLDNPTVKGMFNAFVDLISFHLQTLEENTVLKENDKVQRLFRDELEKKVLERTNLLEEQNIELERMNKDLQSFAYISSHDLQEPLRKIQTFALHILEKEYENLSETGKDYFKRMQSAAERMQALINDLLTYSRTSDQDDKLESLDLDEIVKEVKADLHEEVETRKAVIEFNELGKINAITFQMRQLIYNLVSNSLKFSDPMRAAVISIKSRMGKGSELAHKSLLPDQEYYHISIADNGIGFDQVYSEKIFELFQRLHPQDKYKGTGIGLAIVKRIVENHKGIVTVNSAINLGTTFNVYLSAV